MGRCSAKLAENTQRFALQAGKPVVLSEEEGAGIEGAEGQKGNQGNGRRPGGWHGREIQAGPAGLEYEEDWRVSRTPETRGCVQVGSGNPAGQSLVGESQCQRASWVKQIHWLNCLNLHPDCGGLRGWSYDKAHRGAKSPLDRGVKTWPWGAVTSNTALEEQALLAGVLRILHSHHRHLLRGSGIKYKYLRLKSKLLHDLFLSPLNAFPWLTIQSCLLRQPWVWSPPQQVPHLDTGLILSVTPSGCLQQRTGDCLLVDSGVILTHICWYVYLLLLPHKRLCADSAASSACQRLDHNPSGLCQRLERTQADFEKTPGSPVGHKVWVTT